MYAAYLLETQGKHMLETPHGFLTYGFDCVPGVPFSHVYIEDLYVVPEMRKTHIASTMADRVASIAKERGITKMLGSVDKSTKNPEASERVLVAYGMRRQGEHDGTVWFVKDL